LDKDSIQSISCFASVEEETRIKSTIFKQWFYPPTPALPHTPNSICLQG
jgi:hypothetical protein